MSRGSALVLGGIAALGVIGLAAWMLRPHETGRIPLTDVGAPPAQPALPGKSSPSPKEEILPAQPSTLSFLGSIQSETQSALSVRMPSRIMAVPVKEGDTVRAGQLLVAFDTTDLHGQINTADAGELAARAQVNKAEKGRAAQKVKADGDVQAARATLQTAQESEKQAAGGVEAARTEQQANVKLAQEGVKKAETGLAQAKQTFASLEELAKIGGVARNELDGAKRQVTTSEADLATAKAQLQQATALDSATGEPMRVAAALRSLQAAQQGVATAKKGVTLAEAGRTQALAVADSEVAAARAGLVQAQAGGAAARSGATQTRLVSPIDGVVSSLAAHPGETAQPGVPLLTVVSLGGLRADALVPARHLSRLSLGQTARVSVDTDPGHTYPAQISDIARIAEPDGRTFRVRFRLLNRTDLRPGQTARITVSLKTDSN